VYPLTVKTVSYGSLADKAGVKTGMLLRKVNGYSVEEYYRYGNSLGQVSSQMQGTASSSTPSSSSSLLLEVKVKDRSSSAESDSRTMVCGDHLQLCRLFRERPLVLEFSEEERRVE